MRSRVNWGDDPKWILKKWGLSTRYMQGARTSCGRAGYSRGSNCPTWAVEFGSAVPSCQNRERDMISDGSCWFSKLPVRIFSPQVLGRWEESGF